MSYKQLPAHNKLRITVERSRWSDYRHGASSRALWNRRFDVGIGLHRERCFNAVERDAARSSQAIAEDENGFSDFARPWCGLYRPAQGNREFEKSGPGG